MANIELDGANKKIKVDSGDLTLDVPGDIILDADGADLVFADGGTNILKITNSSSDVVLQPGYLPYHRYLQLFKKNEYFI